ncbi:hypothetical protein [Nocardia crassostreae]|uniref:hypothetical protein n=1 Tax=Nocardia crassostreae TaxID=53428 RepID=UPI000A49E216|nr:hypothetical protein [Nocardia crassostreae]
MTEIQTGRRPDAARTGLLLLAHRAIIVALMTGICEMLLRAAIALEQSEAEVGDLTIGLLTRVALYLAVYTVSRRMLVGTTWARWVLIIGLGVFGLLSLLIEPVTELLAADEPLELLTDVTWESLIPALFRTVHVLAVLVAVPAMLRAGLRSGRN